jgi:putative ABC transport system permease protein
MNVMVMAVYERIREIGTIAAIGTLPRKILSLFMVEGFLLGVLGSFLGALLSTGIILILNFRKITFAFGQQAAVVLAPTISPAEILLTSTLVVGVALLASLQPAWKASRMEPIQALRHV